MRIDRKKRLYFGILLLFMVSIPAIVLTMNVFNNVNAWGITGVVENVGCNDEFVQLTDAMLITNGSYTKVVDFDENFDLSPSRIDIDGVGGLPDVMFQVSNMFFGFEDEHGDFVKADNRTFEMIDNGDGTVDVKFSVGFSLLLTTRADVLYKQYGMFTTDDIDFNLYTSSIPEVKGGIYNFESKVFLQVFSSNFTYDGVFNNFRVLDTLEYYTVDPALFDMEPDLRDNHVSVTKMNEFYDWKSSQATRVGDARILGDLDVEYLTDAIKVDLRAFMRPALDIEAVPITFTSDYRVTELDVYDVGIIVDCAVDLVYNAVPALDVVSDYSGGVTDGQISSPTAEEEPAWYDNLMILLLIGLVALVCLGGRR